MPPCSVFPLVPNIGGYTASRLAQSGYVHYICYSPVGQSHYGTLKAMYGAVDIGGTKTLVAVFDAHGKITKQVKFPTPENYDDFVVQLSGIVEKLSTKDFKRVGVAAPGIIDRKRGVGIVFGNLPWENVPLEASIEKIFNAPVKVENDAKTAALSEAQYLKQDFKKIVYVTVSTGIGVGVVTNGKIDTNLRDIEPGQMILEHNGRFEQWEDFASGSAIYKKYGKKASDITDTGAWYTIARNLAVGLNALIASIDPDVIVIGGGVGTHLEKFQERLEEQLKIYENPMTPVPPIKKAIRPEEAVIYGCYELAKS